MSSGLRRHNDGVRALELKVPPVAWFALAALAMGLLARFLPGGTFRFPGQLLVASMVLLAAGLVGMAGVRSFLRAGTTANPLRPEQATRLVADGMYRHSRNPMYLALLLALAAWGIWLGSVPALLVLPGFVLLMNRLQIQPEERAMTRLFGEQYLDYRRRVRRWI